MDHPPRSQASRTLPALNLGGVNVSLGRPAGRRVLRALASRRTVSRNTAGERQGELNPKHSRARSARAGTTARSRCRWITTPRTSMAAMRRPSTTSWITLDDMLSIPARVMGEERAVAKGAWAVLLAQFFATDELEPVPKGCRSANESVSRRHLRSQDRGHVARRHSSLPLCQP